MHRFLTETIGDGRQLQRGSAIVVMLIAAGTLVGLASGIDWLIRWLPSSTSMNPVTAIVLVICAGVFLTPASTRRWAMPAVAAMMLAVAALKLGQAAVGSPLGIDQLLAAALKRTNTVLPDAIAINTAVALGLFGLALAIGPTERPSWAIAAQGFAIAAMAIAVMALAGFALNSTAINQLTFNRMAVNTAVALAALGMAILTLNPRHGLMRLLLSKGPSGTLARRALPICLLVPIILGVARLWIQRDFGLSTGDGVAIMVAGNITLSLGLLWGCLILLLKSDAVLRANSIALAISEAQYRQAGRIGKMGHWQYDVARNQLHWTKEFRALLELDPEIAPDFAVMNARIHPDDRDQARNLMARAQTLGEDWSWQLRLLGPDGDIRHAKSHGICHRSPDGSMESILGVLADITELETARQGAESATRAQAAFLANMSHEIRTPLNGVMGFIDLLLDSKLDATQRRYLSLVSESAQSLLKLLNDILDLSKVEAGQMEIAAAPTDLRRTVRHAVRLMAPTAEQKQVALTVAIDPHFPAGVMVDSARFRQILLNILGNALKFTENGSVAVTLKCAAGAGGEALIHAIVKDSGIGIPADRLASIFEPFVQGDNSTSRQFGGSGLGLSISRQLAESMGGSLDLDSALGEGTTVTLSLPLEVAVTERVEGHEMATSLVNGGDEGIAELVAQSQARRSLSVLLVEDFALNRELVEAMLKRLGHQVEFACNGVEAVDVAARLATEPRAWDIILMDIQMPVMNGWEATKRIRALGGAASSIPIIALSANAFENEISHSRECGMDDHLVKPAGLADLDQMIERWGRGERPPSANDAPSAPPPARQAPLKRA